jgi:hypothetical protein
LDTQGKVEHCFNPIVTRQRGINDVLLQEGCFGYEIIRKGEVIAEGIFPNGSTTVGKNYLLDAAFRNSGTTANWYIGLIDAASYSALAAADTMSSHGGWVEFEDYTESVRQTWTKSAASSGQITASAASAFTIGAVSSGTEVKGAFVTSVSTKGGTTGILWATGIFPADIPVQEDDIINITYYTQLT